MIREAFSVDEPIGIEVSASSGSVSLEAGPPGKVEVEVDTRRPEAWRVYRSGPTVYATYERGLADRGGRARIRISAPEGVSVRATTASADIRTTLPLGRAALATASGDISLGEAASASLKTASGSIRVGSVPGDLTARSASGDVTVDSVGGRASVTTVSGDVRVELVAGDLAVSTASGDVRLRRYTGEDLEASTISGDVSIGMPAGRTVDLDARTLSGSVRLPERRPSTGSPGPRVSLRLRSVSGDLRIDRLD